jgi:hypothetical protein
VNVDTGIQKDSEWEGGEPVCRLPLEEEQITEAKIMPAKTKAQVRSDRFSPKPLRQEEELTRLRRREKKVFYDRVRTRRK